MKKIRNSILLLSANNFKTLNLEEKECLKQNTSIYRLHTYNNTKNHSHLWIKVTTPLLYTSNIQKHIETKKSNQSTTS